MAGPDSSMTGFPSRVVMVACMPGIGVPTVPRDAAVASVSKWVSEAVSVRP